MAPKTMFHNRSQPLRPTPRDTITPSTSQDSGPPSSTTVSATPSPNHGPQGSTPPLPRRARRPKRDDDDDQLPPPEGPFSEFRLVSSSLKGWKYDVMKFDSRKPVDITAWSKPVKLNRKEMKRNLPGGPEGAPPPVPVGPMLGPDGKPVVGADGRMVMVDADGRPIRSGQIQANGGGSNGGAADGAGANAKGKEKDKAAARKRFQKKTKQVFLVPDEVRQLRREERHPWVIEDGSGQEVWLAAMEEVSKARTQAMFMPTATDVFKFVPAHRWYKFQKKPNYHIPDLEEAETLMSKIQKNKDPERWFLRNKNGQGPSEETKAMFKTERGTSVVPSGSSLVHSASQSLGPGGRKLKAVDSGMDGLFGDDDEEGVDSGRRRKKEFGAEGDLDELDFEEDFQDDDEKAEPDVDDEEAKELEERLKREYKTANKARDDGAVGESEEEEDDQQLTGAGKDMRKLMKKLEKNGAYDDSDDDKNPYASSEEEPDEEVPIVPQGPAIIAPEPRADSRSTSQAPSASQAGTKTPGVQAGTETGSRPTSPVPLPGHGGHSVVAKRATSPNAKMPKLKANGSSRAGSPLAGGSRATSPVGSPPAGRADSPAQSPTLGSSSPTLGSGKLSNKRKAEESTAEAGAPSRPKKRKAQVAVTGELEDWMVVEWLRQTPSATTRDCIHHFTPYLKTEEKKQAFTKLVKEVAQLKNGVLVLRNSYRNSVSAPSPAAALGAE